MSGARGLPDALERRELLYAPQKRSVDFTGLGERYLEQGRLSEALDCFERLEAGARKAAVERVRDQAVAAGDAFLLARLDVGSPLDEATWRRAFEAAKAAGKDRFALRIARKLGDAPAIEALERALGLRTAEAAPPAPEPSATDEARPTEPPSA